MIDINIQRLQEKKEAVMHAGERNLRYVQFNPVIRWMFLDLEYIGVSQLHFQLYS